MTSSYDTSRAPSEPSLGFRSLVVRFDSSVKIAATALLHFEKAHSDEALGELEKLRTGGSWAELRVRDVAGATKTAIQVLSGLWVAEVQSAFERFLEGSKAELARWAAVRNLAPPEYGQGTSPLSIQGLYESNQWSLDFLAPHLQTLEYLQNLRNCVVHRDGIASHALAKKALDDQYASEWPLLNERPIEAPSFPQEKYGERLQPRPSHAIFMSMLCNRLAHDVPAC